MSAIAAFIGRLLLALLFVASGFPKIIDPSGTAQMLAAKSLPPALAMPTGIFEVVAGLLLALGIMTRLVSFLLAGFVALTILFFHHDFASPQGMGEVLMHLALIGGLLVVFAYGHMRWSYDHIRATRKGEVVAADATARAHEAELRAARAEGAAQAAGVPLTDADTRPAKRKWF